LDIEADFTEEPAASTPHFFVIVNEADPDIDDEAAGLELGMVEPKSITTFLILPTITARVNPRKKDPIVSFAKSIILTSE
jgi:hypothetical protein